MEAEIGAVMIARLENLPPLTSYFLARIRVEKNMVNPNPPKACKACAAGNALRWSDFEPSSLAFNYFEAWLGVRLQSRPR
ncbi:MAG: hypothetical protein BGO78_05300 [Chloroflexi bacterium 44-23]|nr:MAG: hypothetical protein BGO78_05300 [Chloroflexi bacterium 44-23]